MGITTSTELKKAISLLEIEQEAKGRILKAQFQQAYEILKPVSIFKGLVKDTIASPNLIGNILSTTIGMTTGFYTNKIIVGASTGILRKVIGSAISSGVTALIARHPETLTSVGRFLSQITTTRKKKETHTMQT